MKQKETIILDACSLINLMNGGQLDAVLALSNVRFIVGEAVYLEVAEVQEQKNILDTKVGRGEITIYREEIPVDLLDENNGKYGLGDGEIECICISRLTGFHVCCDDKNARKAITNEVGDSLLLGSLRLLKKAVNAGQILCKEARNSYLEMMRLGGFLPKNVSADYFCIA